MSRSRFAQVVTVATGSVLAAVLMSAPANATPKVGVCTSSYAPYTYDDFWFDPAAQDIFAVIDTNGDGIICFKFYPNGDHNGHVGNLVDNKAAPHAS
jgi:hypothetical protein